MTEHDEALESREGTGTLAARTLGASRIGVYTALQRRGIESKFLYFPDENHWVLKPANSVQWHDTVNAWLDQHIGAGAK